MPYRRRRSTKRVYKRKARTVSKPVKQYIAQAIKRKEQKGFIAMNTSSQVISSGVSWNNLCAIPQGDSDQARTGSQIRPYRIRINYQWTSHKADTWNNVRFMVLQLKRNVPYSSLNFSDLPTATEPVTWSKTNQYRILYDKMNVQNSFDNETLDMHYPMQRVFISGKKLREARWDNTSTGGVAPDFGGCILIYAVTTSGVADHPVIAFEAVMDYMH